MICRNLELTDFRNFASESLEFPSGVAVVVGSNAQGKSNLLEAVLALSTGRGRATRPLAELIRIRPGSRSPFARVRAAVETRRGRSRLELIFAPMASAESDGQGETVRVSRKATVDGKGRALTEFVGRFNAVEFSPEDIDILLGAPSLRRRFLDVSVSQVNPAYLQRLVDYNHVLSQRNALLRDIRSRGRADDRSLEYWDVKLAELAGPIVEARQRFVNSLSQRAVSAYADLSGGPDRLGVAYAVERPAGADEMDLMHALAVGRTRELRLGQTLAGPHRDDLSITLSGRACAGFASRGEQRLIVLSLKLGQLAWLADLAGESPVLLLDDIFSELDSWRRQAVVDRLPAGAQVLVSSADETHVPAALHAAAAVLRVNEGSLAWEKRHA